VTNRGVLFRTLSSLCLINPPKKTAVTFVCDHPQFFILGITLSIDYLYGDSSLFCLELVPLDLIIETVIILPHGLVLRVYSRAGLLIPMTMLGVIVGEWCK